MKLINITILSMLFAGCSGNKPSLEQFRSLLKGNEQKAIIVSCIRCGCVIEDINHILEINPAALNGYSVLADTTCTAKFIAPVNMRHVPQTVMDSLSMDFYNVIIINGKNEKVKMVKTEESEQMIRFL